MVRVGIVGVGFMGMVHYLTYQKLKGVKVVAIASRNVARRNGDWRDIRGNFGPAGEVMDLSGIATYGTVDEMLNDPRVDLVDICLPPSLHADVAVRALRSDKHVFCEKPICLQPRDADRMVKSAQAAGKQLLIGHVLPFFPEYRWARQSIESGRFGALLGGEFRRVIADPAWLPDYWSSNRTGGPMLDLHVHDAHFIRAVFGMPTHVCTAGRMRGDCAEYWSTQFRFSTSGLCVTATSGTICQPGRSFLHGFEIHLERATLAFEFLVTTQGAGYTCAPVQFGPGDKVTRPELGDGDPMHAFALELAEVIRSVRSGKPAPLLDATLARDAVMLCHKQTVSLVRGRPVKVA